MMAHLFNLCSTVKTQTTMKQRRVFLANPTNASQSYRQVAQRPTIAHLSQCPMRKCNQDKSLESSPETLFSPLCKRKGESLAIPLGINVRAITTRYPLFCYETDEIERPW